MNGGKVLGVAQMTTRLKSLAAKFPDRVGAAIYQEAQIEKTEAQRRTPVEFGTLRASAMVSPPRRSGRNISVTISFGGAAAAYAVYVHENLDAFHKIGQAKYLESVLNESRSHMAVRIARRVHLNRTAEE
jgi:hypothetical protein